MFEWFVSVLRTFVPAVLGTVIAWLAVHGFDWLNLGAYQDRISAWLIVVCITGYYALARWLEQRWPAFGIMMGIPRRPAYIDQRGRPAPGPASAELLNATGRSSTR